MWTMSKRGDFACPACGDLTAKVVDVRNHPTHRRRRRQCAGCGHRYSTVEIVVKSPKFGRTHVAPATLTAIEKARLLRAAQILESAVLSA